jgi:hypothetical protein
MGALTKAVSDAILLSVPTSENGDIRWAPSEAISILHSPIKAATITMFALS